MITSGSKAPLIYSKVSNIKNWSTYLFFQIDMLLKYKFLYHWYKIITSLLIKPIVIYMGMKNDKIYVSRLSTHNAYAYFWRFFFHQEFYFDACITTEKKVGDTAHILHHSHGILSKLHQQLKMHLNLQIWWFKKKV